MKLTPREWPSQGMADLSWLLSSTVETCIDTEMGNES